MKFKKRERERRMKRNRGKRFDNFLPRMFSHTRCINNHKREIKRRDSRTVHAEKSTRKTFIRSDHKFSFPFLPPPRKYIRLEEIEFERRGRDPRNISRWNFRVSKYQLSVLFAFKTYSLTVMKYRAGAWHTSLVRPVIGRIFLFWFFSLPLSPSLQRLCPLYTSYDVNYRDLITMKNSWQMTAG